MASINDIISLSQKGFKDNKIIQSLINDDIISSEKAYMIKADSYYNGVNDVDEFDFRQYKANGIVKTNENRSNQRISNNYLKLLVDQLVNYVVGNGITYKHEDVKFMEYLDKKLLYDFTETISYWLEESRIKGRSYLHFYYNQNVINKNGEIIKKADGKLEYAAIPAEQIIPIYKDDFKKDLQQIIRYYSVEAINKKGEEVLRKKVEWWTETEVKYFIEDDKGNFVFESAMAHWNTSIDTDPTIVEPHAWGRVPFIELRTGIRGISDLQDVKGFIDAYDLLLSEFVNQLADVRELLIKVIGYSGSSADEILQCFRSTGLVKIDGDPGITGGGNIDVLKSEIPVEARQAALKALKDNIFTMGKGVDTNPEKFGTAIAGIAIQMMYKPLDMKADIAIQMMKRGLGDFMWFIVNDYNRQSNGAIDSMDIDVSFNKNTIEDMATIIDSSVKLKGIVSDETIWERIPGIDPAIEDERMAKQGEKDMEMFNNQVMQNNNLEEGK